MIGLRRFATDLPAVDEFVSLGEGDTPLLPLHGLARKLGLGGVSAKMELLNPTGSYKDRVAAMSMSLVRQRKMPGWIATSSGNAGLAMAAYGRRARIPGFLCMVSSAPVEKRLALMPYAIGIVAVEGSGSGSTSAGLASMMEQVSDAATRHGLFLGITANKFNPDGMRGIDTIAYELTEQLPDASHVYVPTGGGGLLASIARGFEHRSRRPRIVACQPSGCAPIVRYVDGELETPEVDRCESEISALQLPKPPDGELAATAVNDSDGWGTAATDEAILAAQRLLAVEEGIFVEPAAAATVAALLTDVNARRLGSTDHPVLILSGAGWKDLAQFNGAAEGIPVIGIGELTGSIDTWAAAVHA